jgi:hypothetical protein
MRAMQRFLVAVVLVAGVVVVAPHAGAVVSTDSVPSALVGNGHNISFDGRFVLVREASGWRVRLLRPEAITFRPDGLPDASGPLWSPSTLVIGEPLNENALAICEPDPTRAPFRCDDAGAPSGAGPYDCYDTWILDSDAVTTVANGGFVLRRRHLMVWVASPKTATASVHKFQWLGGIEPLAPVLRGIEPTMTADGKLLVWQGHPSNDGRIDNLMYATNANACSATGWTAPQSIANMSTDPHVAGVYKLGEKVLRAADGSVFAPNALVHGAYPWLMPDGSAVIFSASNMACRATEDPPGCGPRRNSTAVLGYPTNWGIAVIDGGINPSSADGVRLFFSSPGPGKFAGLPVTPGADVWPFFGTNTSNYVELSFDDGLDGKYAGFWHMNESVTPAGDLDRTRLPDVSGYFNTGQLLGGAQVAVVNDGPVGRALTFDGIDDRVEVAASPTLSPQHGITLDFWIRPTSNPDCDGNNNYRVVLSKGPIDGPYSVVLEENRALQVRFTVGTQTSSLWTPVLPLAQWTHVSCEWDGPSGDAGCWYDDQQVVHMTLPTGVLAQNTASLVIGAPGARAACPNGDGAFAGQLDELAISRVARRLGTPVPPDPMSDAGVDPTGDANTDHPPGAPGGCCSTSRGLPSDWAIVAGVAAWIGRRRRRRE